MKKFNLKGVKIQSFVTKLEPETEKTVKGAGFTDTADIEICMYTENHVYCYTFTGPTTILNPICTAPK